jgi:hypothetical protein
MFDSEAAMTATDHLSSQFSAPSGDPDAKKALLKQLKPDFPKDALAWLRDDQVTVDAPAKIDPDAIDWEAYPDWRASRQLKHVVKVAKKKIDKGKGRPSVMASRPGSDKLDVIDGHHHALARIDHKQKPFSYVVHVPSAKGAWDDLHDHQTNDRVKDDFGKTSKRDRND